MHLFITLSSFQTGKLIEYAVGHILSMEGSGTGSLIRFTNGAQEKVREPTDQIRTKIQRETYAVALTMKAD